MKLFRSDLIVLLACGALASEERAWRAPTLGALWRELYMRALLRDFAERDRRRYLEAL